MQPWRNKRLHQAVPPTVMPSMRSVGWPTPTGTLWPLSLIHIYGSFGGIHAKLLDEL